MSPASFAPHSQHDDELLPEASELRAWTSNAVFASDVSSEAATCSRICRVLNRYLEQSALLDPVLPSMVTALAAAAIEERPKLRHRLFVVLYTIAKVRGAKFVVRVLPHEPATFRILSNMMCEAFPCSSGFVTHWETHYFLLLWLSAAVLVPFPLRSIVPEPVLDALYDQGVQALRSSSKISDGAATFLASFLTRRDTEAYLRKFVNACLSGEGTRGTVDGPAAAAALARIFKTGRRDELAPHVPALVGVMGSLVDETSTGGMKLKSKLSQRLVLAFLKEHACNWRYERGSRLLFGAMEGGATSELASPASNSYIGAIDTRADGAGENWIIPAEEEIVEQVIEVLLHSLRHRDTVVRWSAAKGVGRIAGRLPLQHAEDVVGAVLNTFSSSAMARADSAWHGGCLALAELARRGLILPATPHFAALFDVVRRASAFDVRRGAHSVGAHVRDAACYVVWALARAYTSSNLSAHAVAICETMIPTCLLDREVNCRRAASAALQECVGRLSRGLITEGIQLVTLMDYYALGDRQGSYLQIAPRVSALSNGLYFDCILDELWAGKLMHWDDAVRSLAARALAALVPHDTGNKLFAIVIPKLLQVVVRRVDGLHRHGALLGLAELLAVLDSSLSADNVKVLQTVPRLMYSKGYFKGRLGDLIRTGVCRLIMTCASAELCVYSTSGEGRVAADDALAVLENTLGGTSDVDRGKSTELTGIALSAYERLCHAFVCSDESWSKSVAARVTKGLLSSPLVELQRGYALAAGAMDPCLATTGLFGSLVESLSTHKDVEVRRNAAISLGKLVPIPDTSNAVSVVQGLVEGMADYAVDERGDVGSWVREASMSAFSSLVVSLLPALRHENHVDLDEECHKAVEAVVTQAFERISRTRGVAYRCLSSMRSSLSARDNEQMHCDSRSETEASLRDLEAAFDGFAVQKIGDGAVTGRNAMLGSRELSDLARQLLLTRQWCRAALTGLIASCGGNAGVSSGWALSSILDHARGLRDKETSKERLIAFGDSFLSVIAGGGDRKVVPAMQAFEFLVRRGSFSDSACAGFLVRAVATARGAWKGRLRDVSRVSAAVSLLSELASVRLSDCGGDTDDGDGTTPAEKASMEALVVVLAGPVPRLRRAAAQGLYIALVEQQARPVSAHGPETQTAIDVLADTMWERLELASARSARNVVCQALDIDAPKPPMRRPPT